MSIKAVDKVGNKSEEAKASLTASSVPTLTKITLNRTHLAYNDANHTITATLTGSNFNLIASQSEQTVKAGIYDENDDLQGSLETVTSINTGNNEASVNLTAPTISADNAGFKGKRYTVKVILCGTCSPTTGSFVITKEARLTKNPELSVNTISSSEVTADTKTKITITGANLAVAGGIRVRLYTSKGVAEGEEITIDASSQEAGTVSSFEADIPVPQKEGVFTAKVFFGSVKQAKIYSKPSEDAYSYITNPSLQVYGTPKFTSFVIPKAGIKEGTTLIAKVWGTNFKAPGVVPNAFTVSCTDKPSLTTGSTVIVFSDSELHVKLKIPGQAGRYTVKIEYRDQSVTETVIVKDYSAYTPGKIVLADNRLVEVSNYSAIDSSNPPVAIICGKNGYGAALGIALHSTRFSWAKAYSTGYNTKFEGIICEWTTTGSEAAATATFEGDTDDSDNWEYICGIDPDGTAQAAENYPTFNWVNQYNTQYATQLGTAKPAWYMPSLAELCEVYKNREVIDKSLTKIHSLDNSYADESFGTSYYWSSSQYSHYYDYKYAYQVDVRGGGVFHDEKHYNSGVCCIAGFCLEQAASVPLLRYLFNFFFYPA